MTQAFWQKVLLALKKHGLLLFSIDQEKLTVLTICSSYPLPRMHDCIDSLEPAQQFSVLEQDND